MDWFGRLDLLLLAVAAYVAVMSLVRLMRARRDELVADVQRQVDTRKKQARAVSAESETENRPAA
jgi:hypothetical protein